MRKMNFAGEKQTEKVEGKLDWLLGFRSNKTWKKVISSFYLITLALNFIITIFEVKAVYVSTSDYLINKVSDIIIFIIAISPYIFLSNTKLREKLPLFRDYTKKSSFLGMVVVIIALSVAFGVVSSGLSDEFLSHTEGHTYEEAEMVAPSCKEEGRKTYVCKYCGETKDETLPKIAEHNFVEVSREEPTVESEGKIITQCMICEKEEVEIIEKLPPEEIVEQESENEEEIRQEKIDDFEQTVQVEKEKIEVEEKKTTQLPSSATTEVVTVYDTPTGKRYHYSRSCAGKNAYETTLEKARRNGKTPCKQCA